MGGKETESGAGLEVGTAASAGGQGSRKKALQQVQWRSGECGAGESAKEPRALVGWEGYRSLSDFYTAQDYKCPFPRLPLQTPVLAT